MSDPNRRNPAPHEKFLSALDATPAPPQFAADDQAFRTQLPIAIAHLKATMAAAEAVNAQRVSNEVEAYVEAMIPSFRTWIRPIRRSRTTERRPPLTGHEGTVLYIPVTGSGTGSGHLRWMKR